MEYKELSKLYHMNTGSSRDSDLNCEEKARRTASSTYSTGFETPNGELFIAIPLEMSVLNERVLRAERKVTKLMNALPPIACNAVLRSLVLDEVVSTNAIENIQSTRRQVKDAVDAIRGNRKTRRFKELATLYLDIVYDEAAIPETPEDIRAIYDRVMDGELPDDYLPDGQMFRAKGVAVTSGGIEVIHTGLEPESKILSAIELMLRLANSDEIPAIYAAIASHYIFEYAHPFYDGNGRTGRYLLSLFLNEPLSKPTVLSLSRTIAENGSDYYKAFRTAADPLNRGELTFFVQTMLELIRKAQISIINKLEKNVGVLATLEATLREAEIELSLRPQEAQATFVLMQYDAFGLMGDASVEEFSRYLGIGKQMARRHLAELEKKDVVKKHRLRNPLTFELSDEFKTRHLNWMARENEEKE